MSITVGDNFSYQGGKPLDARFQFSSVANMKAFAEASLYDGCLAYIPSLKKYYTYDSSNTVDTTTGRWRELETGGGGGTSDYNDLTNKPQIAGTTLSGNTSLATLGLTSSVETQFSGSSTKSYVTRGEKYNWNTGNTVYGTCSTSAGTTAKSVTVSRGTFNFDAGAKIAVKFSYDNTASAPTLTVNSTTKNIKYIDADGNVSTPLIWWNAGDIVEFTYDGTQWLMQPTMQMLFSGQGTKIPRESIYSTTEKVVGCWTDGRPVYQKTFSGTFASTTSGTWGDKSIGTISNFREVVSIQGWYNLTDTPAAYIGLPWTTNSGYTSKCRVDKSGSTGSVMLCTNNGNLSAITAYITVQYTKTTDSANSFNYGDPNEYSTTEKIVGTWIDGKALYQKTISCGALPNNTITRLSHGISNLAKVIDIQGRSESTTSSPAIKGINIPYAGDSSTAKNPVECWVEPTNLVLRTYMDLSTFTNTYVTLKYTKS